MNRIETIFAIIDLHNHFCKEWSLKYPTMKLDPWNKEEVEMQIDRYYLVESLTADDNTEYENKKFKPKIEVRKHLRSQEKYAYGKGHQAFYSGYLATITCDISDLDNIEARKLTISTELNDKEGIF